MYNSLKLLLIFTVLPLTGFARDYCWSDSDCSRKYYCSIGSSGTGAGFCERRVSGYCDDRGDRNIWVFISGAWRCMDTKTNDFESHSLCRCPMPGN